jgi:pilus assembly protein CpaB
LGTDDATKQFNELELRGTSVLLPKVLVIGVGTTGLPPEPEPSPSAGAKDKTQQASVSTLLTVSVTPEESVKLVGAIQSGTQNNPAKHIYFGLQGQDVTVDPALEWDAFERRTGQLP